MSVAVALTHWPYPAYVPQATATATADPTTHTPVRSLKHSFEKLDPELCPHDDSDCPQILVLWCTQSAWQTIGPRTYGPCPQTDNDIARSGLFTYEPLQIILVQQGPRVTVSVPDQP